jgi:AraC-like DNA-binding protein
VVMNKKQSNRYRKAQLDVFAAVKDYLEQHAVASLHISFLSQMFGVNSSLLMEGFKAIYSFTIHQYHIKCKLEKACILLTTTELPVKAVSKESGFKNAKHFSTCFKRYKGCTPAAYRKA